VISESIRRHGRALNLGANLTTQVRAIAEVSDAVSKGDLTRSITVQASGKVAALKDNINQMIRNLVQAKKISALLSRAAISANVQFTAMGPTGLTRIRQKE
jgi:nitrogen fixation/metabolism regulation signal transduction histidine kinase